MANAFDKELGEGATESFEKVFTWKKVMPEIESLQADDATHAVIVWPEVAHLYVVFEEKAVTAVALTVQVAYRGQGFYTFLIEKVEPWLKEREITAIHAHAVGKARDLYIKSGWEETGGFRLTRELS